VIFVTQALGVHLSLGQQVAVALASVMAGVGIAGVPEAGLITLPLVLHAAGVPDAVSAAVVPLILPVDWILGRARACTNVLADMSVAVILHRHEDDAPRESDA
jgi:Na+/H+-dicarboxylate symporter